MSTANDQGPTEGEGVNPVDAWLRSELEARGGAGLARELLSAGRARGFPQRTLERARKRVGAVTRKTGYLPGQGWEWRLRYGDNEPRGGENKLVDPHEGWELVPAGELWGDCDLCGTRVQTLRYGVPRCWPRCRDADEALRPPPPDPRTRARREREDGDDRLERAQEQIRLDGERIWSIAAPGRAWPQCSRCGMPAQRLDQYGRCDTCGP
jgi:hypothetical protein